MTSKERLLQLALAGSGGRNWYSDALSDIDEACLLMKWDVRKFVPVLAVTSPQVSVATNVKYACEHMHFGTIPTPLPSVKISLENLIASGYVVGSIRGPKTRRFAQALLGDPEAVVLDVHMGYALKVDPAKLKNKSIQAEAEKRIKWVAKALGWFPAEVQAAIWTAQRDRAGYVYSGVDVESALFALGIHPDDQ